MDLHVYLRPPRLPRAARPAALVALAALALAPSARPAAAQSAAASGALAWPAITRESRPWTRWWWLGSAVDSTNLTRELRGLAEAGFGGVEVTSIYGVHGREADFVPYLSDRWVRLLVHAADEAHRNGMGLDLPPGSGWRMGGPDVPLDEASVSLRLRADTVRGGEVWRGDATARPARVAAFSADGKFVDLSKAGGTAAHEWRAPEGSWVVYSAEIRNNGEKVKRPGPGGEGNAIDVLSRPAVDDYLRSFGERFAAVPHGTIGSFFHDSYEYTGTSSRGFFEAFAARRGYDLTRYLPALAGQGDPELVARVKSDYRETMSDLLRENLLEPFTAWAHREGSLSRNQAHGSPANILDLYAASDIPETEIFGPLGGSDSDPLVSKFASSAAHVAGKKLASSESMTWLAEHFTETLDEVKRAVDQLFVSGINHLVYHGTAYSPSDAAWPGWLFYASTEFNPRNSIWHDLPALNGYVARVQSVLQSGTPDNDLLVYWPIYDSWHDAEGLRMDFRVHDPAWLHEKPVGAVARALWEKGYGFDYVSDRLLEQEVEAASGRLSASGARYAALLVPTTLHMPDSTMSRLVDLASRGATVLFVGALPADVPGAGDLEARRARLRAAESRLTFGAPDASGVRAARVGAGRVLVGGSPESLLLAAGVAREAMVDHPGLHFVRRAFDGGWHYFIANGDSTAVDGWVPLAVGAAAVEVMDPMNGQTGMARTRRLASGGTEVMLRLEPGQSVILRAFRAPVTGPAWSYARPAGAARPLGGRWEVKFLQGGPTLPAPYRTDSLRSWTASGPEAERFAGTARYTLRFDAPDGAKDYLLDLGRVAESARVRVNGKELGTLFARPFRLRTGPLRRTGNVLEIDVTNLSANRIRDLDRRGVKWKNFYDINFVGIDYKPFDASQWPVRDSGLLGPVLLQPLTVTQAPR